MRLIRDILRFRRNLTADRPRPLSVTVNITGRCNLKCAFCEKANDPHPHELPLEQVTRLLDFAAEWECSVFLGGGEPFLHRNIWQILEHVRSQGRRVSIVTNGTRFENLSDGQFTLLGETISVMSLSVDSADAGRHDAIRGAAGVFEKVMRFIRDPRRKNRIALTTVLPPEMSEASGMIDLAAELGCSLNFQPLIFASNFPQLPAAESKQASREALSAAADLAERLKALHRLARKKGVVTNLSLVRRFYPSYARWAAGDTFFGDKLLRTFFCMVPLQQLTVDECGRIQPCALRDGVTDITDGDIYESWRQMALAHRKQWANGARWDVCRSCSCHFAENYRSSILAFPLANWRALAWLMGYYLGRLRHREGRKI